MYLAVMVKLSVLLVKMPNSSVLTEIRPATGWSSMLKKEMLQSLAYHLPKLGIGAGAPGRAASLRQPVTQSKPFGDLWQTPAQDVKIACFTIL